MNMPRDTRSPSYEELSERYEELRHRNLELIAEVAAVREARVRDLASFARSGSNGDHLRREVARPIEDLKAWKARLNPWTAQGWQVETLDDLVRRLTSASEQS